ncbi:hypothetical protein GCM10023317_26000 [Actinopolymorpha pittospori]
MSTVTVFIISVGTVVKKAWNRQTSNSVSCPGACAGVAFRSGIRRTTNRPGIWSAFLPPLNAVNGISATSAREIHWPVGSS